MSPSLKEDINFYGEFKEWYFKIIEDFKFDYQKDILARDYLSLILSKRIDKKKIENTLESFQRSIHKKGIIIIYGCGPSLEDTIKKCKNCFALKKVINLAADGSSILLRQQGIPIHAIFTDLDGITTEEFYYPKYLIIHAHGDNIDQLKYFEKDILKCKKLLATTQVEPLNDMLNPGGFTDGDRILFFIRKLIDSSQKIFLIGMDFMDIVGKYSKPFMEQNMEVSSIKIKKLAYAVQLLQWIMKRIPNEIYFVNSKVISSEFNYISIEIFMEMLRQVL